MQPPPLPAGKGWSVVKPLVGISCCTKQFGLLGLPNHAVTETYVRATHQLVDAVPVLIPADPDATDIPSLLAKLDGILLTGSRSNVQPSLYDGPAHPEGTLEDPARDAAILPLIRAAVAANMPLLAICRGLQELNVALGGSLHQRLQDLPGRIDHSTPLQPSARLRSARAHAVRVIAGSWLHRVAGADQISVNSLHNQGIDQLAPGLVIEGIAPDGTIESVRVARFDGRPVSGFAIGLQWHPEHVFETDALSRRIFASFAEAVHAHANGATNRISAVAD